MFRFVVYDKTNQWALGLEEQKIDKNAAMEISDEHGKDILEGDCKKEFVGKWNVTDSENESRHRTTSTKVEFGGTCIIMRKEAERNRLKK